MPRVAMSVLNSSLCSLIVVAQILVKCYKEFRTPRDSGGPLLSTDEITKGRKITVSSKFIFKNEYFIKFILSATEYRNYSLTLEKYN